MHPIVTKAVELLSSQWLAGVIGIAGIPLAYYFYHKGKQFTRLSFQSAGLRIIGGIDGNISKDVDVRFRGVSVPRLSKTTVIVWNSGTHTIRQDDVPSADRVRIVLAQGATALDAQLSKSTREINGINLKYEPGVSKEIEVGFDFLDPGDGLTVEVLHTGGTARGKVRGTVKGMPEGVEDGGPLLTAARYTLERFGRRPTSISALVARPRALARFTLICAASAFVLGSVPPVASALGYDLSSFAFLGRVLWLGAAFYGGIGTVIYVAARRRFPAALDPYDDDTIAGAFSAAAKQEPKKSR